MAGKVLDFSDVKDGGQYQPRHVPEGDYTAKITAVVDQKAKGDGEDMWVFTLKLVERPSGSYPYYCKLTAEQLWKVRNLLVAAGVNVPKKRMKVDPNRVIGKIVGVAMVDDEYEGRMKSVVDSIYPADDAEEDTGRDDTEDDGDDEEEEDEPPAKPAKKSSKKQPLPEPDEDDEEEDEDEEDDEEEPPPPPKKKAKAAAKSKPAKKSKPAPPPEDDEDEDDDLDVDDDDL